MPSACVIIAPVATQRQDVSRQPCAYAIGGHCCVTHSPAHQLQKVHYFNRYYLIIIKCSIVLLTQNQ